MRILALVVLAIGTVSTKSAVAQTYDPAYPVCLHAYRAGANCYDCRYTSLPQCNASASGRAAQCVINPYFAGAEGPKLSVAWPPRLLGRPLEPPSPSA